MLLLCMARTVILRTRIDPRRKARVEAILRRLGLTPTQVVNLLFAQIEQRKGIPFAISLQNNSDILPSIERVAETWNQLDDEPLPLQKTRKSGTRSLSRLE
jgi:addiction module RelB/DinJ family antitoxin